MAREQQGAVEGAGRGPRESVRRRGRRDHSYGRAGEAEAAAEEAPSTAEWCWSGPEIVAKKSASAEPKKAKVD